MNRTQVEFIKSHLLFIYIYFNFLKTNRISTVLDDFIVEDLGVEIGVHLGRHRLDTQERHRVGEASPEIFKNKKNQEESMEFKEIQEKLAKQFKKNRGKVINFSIKFINKKKNILFLNS